MLQARDALGTPALAGGPESMTRRCDGASAGIPNFDLEVRTRSGANIWVNVSTIVFDDRRTGRRIFVRLAHDIDQHRRNEELLNRMLEVARQFVSLTDDTSHHAPVEPPLQASSAVSSNFSPRAATPRPSRGRWTSPPRHSATTSTTSTASSAPTTRLEAVTHAQRRGAHRVAARLRSAPSNFAAPEDRGTAAWSDRWCRRRESRWCRGPGRKERWHYRCRLSVDQVESARRIEGLALTDHAGDLTQR